MFLNYLASENEACFIIVLLFQTEIIRKFDEFIIKYLQQNKSTVQSPERARSPSLLSLAALSQLPQSTLTLKDAAEIRLCCDGSYWGTASTSNIRCTCPSHL